MKAFINPEDLSATRPRLFQVRIFYSEPSYALHIGRPEKVYRGGTYYVHAADEFHAEALAIAEFKQRSVASNVSWVREIVRCEISRLDANVVLN